MAVSLTERPHKYSFSLNDIRYVFAVSNPDAAGCAVEVELWAHKAGAAGERFHAITLYPDKQGYVYAYIQTYLQSLLEPAIPDPDGDMIQPAGSQASYYFIKYRQVTNANTTASFVSDEVNKCIVLMGGVEQAKFKRNNFFYSYLPTYKPFLTWIPAKRFVYTDQVLFLTFLATATTDTYKVQHKVAYTDGTIENLQQNIDMTATTEFLFRVKAGAQALNLDAIHPTKKLHYYEIRVLDADDVVVVNAYRFYIEHHKLYAWHDLHFTGSLGGFEGIRLKGSYDHEVQTTAEEVQHIAFNKQWDTVTPQGQYSHVNIYKRDVYKGDAGYQHTPGTQEALAELMLSRRIVQWIDGRWIAVQSLKRTQEMGNSADMKWAFPVEWTLGYEDPVYTPKNLALGAGSSEVAVTACSDLAEPTDVTITLDVVPADASARYEYMVSWTFTGTQVGALEFEISYDDGVTWQQLPLILYTANLYMGYTLNSSSDVVHKIRVRNICPGDVSVVREGVGTWAP